MENTGERFIPLQMDGQIAAEHLNRYFFASQIIPLKGKVVLDIASGAGYGSNLLAKKAQFVFGVDISQEAIDYASDNYAKSNISFQQGDCCHIPLPDQSVDVIVSFETIEHITDHEAFFAEIKRVLRSDGVMVMSSPNKKTYTDTPKHDNPYHVKELYNEEFISLVKSYFPYVEYYGQNYMLSSFIYPIDNSDSKWEFPVCYKINEQDSLEPIYNIVIASKIQFPIQPNPLLYIYQDTQTIPKVYKEAYEDGRNSCRNSIYWKVGHALLLPLKRLKDLFCKH